MWLVQVVKKHDLTTFDTFSSFCWCMLWRLTNWLIFMDFMGTRWCTHVIYVVSLSPLQSIAESHPSPPLRSEVISVFVEPIQGKNWWNGTQHLETFNVAGGCIKRCSRNGPSQFSKKQVLRRVIPGSQTKTTKSGYQVNMLQNDWVNIPPGLLCSIWDFNSQGHTILQP